MLTQPQLQQHLLKLTQPQLDKSWMSVIQTPVRMKAVVKLIKLETSSAVCARQLGQGLCARQVSFEKCTMQAPDKHLTDRKDVGGLSS